MELNTMGFLRETAKKIMDGELLLKELDVVYPPAQRSVLGVLDFLPEGFDFFYRIMDKDNTFRFELHEMEAIPGTSIMVPIKHLAECAGEITRDDLLYIDWLGVEEEYRGLQLGYLMLYISGLFAVSRGCYRIALSDATERGPLLNKRTHELRPHIYKNLCLDHRNPRIDELKEIHTRRSSRLNTKWTMVGGLLDLIQKLEGTRDCDPTNPIYFEPKDVRKKISARRVELMELMEMKRKPTTDTSSDHDEETRGKKRFKPTSESRAGAVPKKKSKPTRKRQQRYRTKRAVKTDQFKKQKKKKRSTRRKNAGKSIPKKKVGRRKKIRTIK